MYSPRLYKYRDLCVLYIPTVHTFGTVNFTHTLLVQTHTHDVSAPWCKLSKLKFQQDFANSFYIEARNRQIQFLNRNVKKRYISGLPTKNETSETTVRNLFSLFLLYIFLAVMFN